MRGTYYNSGSLFFYLDLESRIPARHLLQNIRQVVNYTSGLGLRLTRDSPEVFDVIQCHRKMEVSMAVAITRTDMSARELRAAAAKTADAKVARRLLALAQVLE